MEILPQGGQGVDVWDAFAMAECQSLRGFKHVYLAPGIPPKLLNAALRTYLVLQPDELLLAVVDPSGGMSPRKGLALTTRRLYWWDSTGSPAPAAGGEPGSRQKRRGQARAAAYQNLSPRVSQRDTSAPKLELVPGLEVNLGRRSCELVEALVKFLQTMGSAARGDFSRQLSPDALISTNSRLFEVAQETALARAGQGELRSFGRAILAATPRLVVTPLVALVCVVVYVAMVVSGVSAFDPDPEALVDWGANFGPRVVLDHQAWRLVAGMFLHVGFLHILFNMWCLLSAGPLVERLFGNVAFAAIYLLAGIGGSIASLGAHPQMVSVGASGAIFGLFGALLGFLVVHRNAIPASVLKPLRKSAVGFVVYNMIIGAMVPMIDMAAHLGGLATGFVCGLLLQRPLPVEPSVASALRRIGMAVTIAAGLVLASNFVARHVEGELRSAERVASSQKAADSFNHLLDQISPALTDYDDSNAVVNRLFPRQRLSKSDVQAKAKTLQELISRAHANLEKLQQIKVEHPTLKKMVEFVTRAQEEQLGALDALKRYLDEPDEQLITGPGGYVAHSEAASKNTKSFLEQHDAFIKDNGLTPQAR